MAYGLFLCLIYMNFKMVVRGRKWFCVWSRQVSSFQLVAARDNKKNKIIPRNYKKGNFERD
ncbi:hypothetical protein HanPI659440_Chr00c06g0716701 [Helianthus annuus]|nr:hypothetical protein HanPI659440_Chr00c06g0716701 [Helianthus annuus]